MVQLSHDREEKKEGEGNMCGLESGLLTFVVLLLLYGNLYYFGDRVAFVPVS